MRWAGPVIWAGLVCRDLGTLKKKQLLLYYTCQPDDPCYVGSRYCDATSNDYGKLDFNTDKPKHTKTRDIKVLLMKALLHQKLSLLFPKMLTTR